MAGAVKPERRCQPDPCCPGLQLISSDALMHGLADLELTSVRQPLVAMPDPAQAPSSTCRVVPTLFQLLDILLTPCNLRLQRIR